MARPKGNEGDARARLVEAAGRGFRTGGFRRHRRRCAGQGRGADVGRVLRAFQFQGRGVPARGLGRDRDAAQRHRGVPGSSMAATGAIRSSISISANGWTSRCRRPAACRASRRTSRAPTMRRARSMRRSSTHLVEVLVAGFRGAHASERAWSFLAVLSGAAAMARAVKDPRVRREILAAARIAAKAI